MITNTVEESGRVDATVASQLNVSRSFVKVLLDQGKVSVNNNSVYKASAKVHPGDVLQIDFEPTTLADIPEIELDVLYKDDDCLVVYKPAGVLTHSKGAFNPEATVSTFIRQFTSGMEDNRGGIVHRLDRVTSGLLICARTEPALKWLQDQFAERKAKKTYIAVVEGHLDEPEAVIDMPIERNPKKPQTFRAGSNGKVAITQYKVLAENEEYSLVQLQPTTGRTHQLRVHLSQIGHPIVGDELYGGKPAKRVFLHALSLELTLPNKEHHIFTTDTPTEFTDIVK
jgi:23S rRNA pseudouridine1911/1915/1917 synthase